MQMAVAWLDKADNPALGEWESLASPPRRQALRSSLDGVEASAQHSAEVRPGEGNLIEIKLLADPTGRDQVPMNPGKGERLRRAFEERLTAR